MNVYRGSKVRLEAVLANHDDVLKRWQVPGAPSERGSNMKRLFDRTVDVEIADSSGRPEPPFIQPVLSGEIALDGPTGKYRFLATFQRGVPADGR